MACRKCGAPADGPLCRFHAREQYRDWDLDDDSDGDGGDSA